MRSTIIAAVWIAATITGAADARAEPRRVALIGADDELAAAATVTLQPWGIALVATDAPPPGDRLPAAATAAAQLAARLDVSAAVWITSAPDGAVVWVSDRPRAHVIARAIADAPPYDPPAAAAVALTIKTLLRHSEAAPAAERFGASSPAAVLRMEGWVGARARPSGDGDGEPRLGLWVAWRAPVADRRLTLRVGLRSGPGSSVNEPRFVGRHADTAVSAEVAYRIPIGDRFEVQPGLGATLQWAVLDGVVVDASTRARVRRINPSVDASLTAGVRLGELWLGGRVSGAYLTRHQEFFVAGEPIFELSNVELEVGLIAAVPLY